MKRMEQHASSWVRNKYSINLILVINNMSNIKIKKTVLFEKIIPDEIVPRKIAT